jgi:RNA recognition motif-containing protein
MEVDTTRAQAGTGGHTGDDQPAPVLSGILLSVVGYGAARGEHREQSTQRRGSTAHTPRKTSRHIFVGNLTFTATEAEVRQLFEGYGTVDTVRLLTDRETGQARGFGFVEMPNATEARAAIAGLHGTSLGGRPLTINEARPRDERGGPRRGPRW